MQRAHHQVAKRQTTNAVTVPDVGSFSGDATASTGVNIGTSLLVGTTRASSASVTNPLVPGQDTITLTTSSTSTETGATSSASSSPSSSPSLSTGTVVGITVGVFVVVIGAMFAIYASFKRRTASRARRTTARGPPRVVRGAGGGSGSGKEKKGGVDHGDSKERPISGATNITTGKIALFRKELSVRSLSDEKVNVSGPDNDTFDPSAMPDFTKYHGALTDGPSNLPPSRPFVAREEGSPVVSWDSDAGSGDPLLSLRASASASGTMSPSSVTARQTPRAIGDSALHYWESAEVLIMDDHTAERPSVYSDVTQNPFHDNSVPRPSNSGSDSDSRVGGRNPFFSAGQQNPFADRSTRSRKSSVSTAKRSRSSSSGSTVRAGANEGALLSLIAALDKPPVTSDEHTIRTSLQTVTTSIYSPTEPGVPMPAPNAF